MRRLADFFASASPRQVLFVLAAVGYITYFNSLSSAFVQDDYSAIVENPVVHSLSSLPYAFKGGSFAFGTTISDIYYRPLSTVAFTFIYVLFGPHPFFYHLIQIGIHIVNSFFVYLIFQRFYKKITAVFSSLIFLIHPINVESVIYISGLQGVIFTLCGLGAFLTLASSKLDLKKSVIVATLVFVALLFKETALVFIPIFITYTLLYHQKNSILLTLLSTATAGTYFLLRFVVLGRYPVIDSVLPMMQLNFWQRLLSLPKIVVYYLSTFFFPKDLATGQVWVVSSPTPNNFYLPLLIIILFFVLLIIIAKYLLSHNRPFLKPYVFFSLWFTFGLLPYLQLIPLNQTVAERYFYIAIIGLLGLLNCALQSLRMPKTLAVLLVIVLLSGLLTRTVIRNHNWQDGLSLAKHDLTYSGPSYVLENTLGYEYSQRGDLLQAETHYLQSTQLVPNWWISLSNLGSVQFKYARLTNRPDYINKAEANFKTAVASSKNFSTPYESLIALYFYTDSYTKSRQFASDSVKRFPQNAKLWFFLGLSEYELGNKTTAQEALKKAIMLDPQNSQYRQVYQYLLQNKPFKLEKI